MFDLVHVYTILFIYLFLTVNLNGNHIYYTGYYNYYRLALTLPLKRWNFFAFLETKYIINVIRFVYAVYYIVNELSVKK